MKPCLYFENYVQSKQYFLILNFLTWFFSLNGNNYFRQCPRNIFNFTMLFWNNNNSWFWKSNNSWFCSFQSITIYILYSIIAFSLANTDEGSKLIKCKLSRDVTRNNATYPNHYWICCYLNLYQYFTSSNINFYEW